MSILRFFGRSFYLYRVAAVAGVCVILADQLTKDAAQMLWDEGGPSFGGLFLRLSKNPGVALGALGTMDESLRVPVLLLLSLFAAVGIAVISRPFAEKVQLRGWGLALVYAGAVGNSIDRFWHGSVIDFIEIHIGELVLPAFNIADISVGIGAFLIVAVVAHGALRRRDARQGRGDNMERERQELWVEDEILSEVEEKRRGALLKMTPGTTLVEILIVVAIIGLVLGAVAIGVVPLFAKGQAGTAWNETKVIEGMYAVWVISNAECPSSVDDLIKAAGKKGQSAVDPWGTPYEIQCPSQHDMEIDVISAGPDKKLGTDDDIGNWMPQPK